jgi:hypothetical protein
MGASRRRQQQQQQRRRQLLLLLHLPPAHWLWSTSSSWVWRLLLVDQSQLMHTNAAEDPVVLRQAALKLIRSEAVGVVHVVFM